MLRISVQGTTELLNSYLAQQTTLQRSMSGVDQLVEIIKVLGTPTREEIQMMNPNYTEFRFPNIRPHPWSRVFRARTPQDAIDLVAQLLRYTPTARLSPLQAMTHEFFDELRSPNCKLPSSNPMPALFDFSEQELAIEPMLNSKLMPKAGMVASGSKTSISKTLEEDTTQSSSHVLAPSEDPALAGKVGGNGIRKSSGAGVSEPTEPS
uniref:Uncharacterized protein n=1 Tax=Ditylenchus dipsaci TaxID=166011 RepID=A0A915EC69_9BILA